MNNPTTSTPYNGQHIRLKRNDAVRYMIWQALQEGAWQFDALLELLNLMLKENDCSDRYKLSANGLRTMLRANCEGAWTFDGNVVALVENYQGSLLLWQELRREHILAMMLNDGLHSGRFTRDKYKCHFGVRKGPPLTQCPSQL